MINPEFFDIINFSICQAVNDYLKDKAQEFFKKVGKYHLNEARKRDLLTIDTLEKPLDILIKIARYLESMGYMEKISITKLSEKEAIIEMQGVSVTKSSIQILKKGKHPSHYMTNIMFASLHTLGVQAELMDMEFDEKEESFKEFWKIL